MTGNFLLLTSRYNIDVNQIMIRNLGGELTKTTTNTVELQKAIDNADQIVESVMPVEYDSEQEDVQQVARGGRTCKKGRFKGGYNRTKR
jgi:hypothetical protein